MTRNSFWRVPLVALIAGLLWTPVTVRLLLAFAIKKGPDGVVVTNDAVELAVYAFLMVAVLFVGGMILLRRCTRREIFFSATLLVVYMLVVIVSQHLLGAVTGPMAVVYMKLAEPFQWTYFPTWFLIEILPVDITNPVHSALLLIPAFFVPYLFVLFGRRSPLMKETVDSGFELGE